MFPSVTRPARQNETAIEHATQDGSHATQYNLRAAQYDGGESRHGPWPQEAHDRALDSPDAKPGFRGLKVNVARYCFAALTAILRSEKLIAASLRRGADLKSFPEGIS
jgi:hypothetical protein